MKKEWYKLPKDIDKVMCIRLKKRRIKEKDIEELNKALENSPPFLAIEESPRTVVTCNSDVVRYLWKFPKLIEQEKDIGKTTKKLLRSFKKIFKGISQNITVCFNNITLQFEVYVTIRY